MIPGNLIPTCTTITAFHEEGPAVDQLRTLTALQPRVDWEQGASHRDKTLRIVSAYCGLAGVVPDWKSGTILAGRVEFQDQGARASIWISNPREHIENEIKLAEKAKLISGRAL